MSERFPLNSREYADSMVNTLRESLLVLDAGLRIMFANASFYRTFKVRREETVGKRIFDLGNRQWDIPRLRQLLEHILPASNVFDDYEVEHTFPKIGQRVMLLNARRIVRRAHKTELILLAIEDITKRKKLERALRESREHLRYTSYHDALTGVYNRAYFEEEMARLGKDLSRSKPLSMISIDIDGLKAVNDTFGHKAGDGLLIAAAKVISAPFRKIDVIARVGGDEFCVLLPGADHKTTRAKKTEIIERIGQHNAKVSAAKLNMSIGVATSQEAKGETIYGIYQRADKSMYRQKDARRAGVRNRGRR